MKLINDPEHRRTLESTRDLIRMALAIDSKDTWKAAYAWLDFSAKNLKKIANKIYKENLID